MAVDAFRMIQIDHAVLRYLRCGRQWWIKVHIPVLLVLGQPDHLWSHEDDSGLADKAMKAIRIHSAPPRIDGVHDDEIWREAPLFTGLTQRRPDEGQPASEKTTFQFAYDDKALYVAIMAYDREPDLIVSRLARRDHWSESDFVQVVIDAHHDHQTDFVFMLFAGGSVMDGYNYNDGAGWDGTWDGTWEARQAQHANGWSSEFRIPYHVLRFNPQQQYTWGLNVIRYISRKKEDSHWVLVRLAETGWPSHFAHLEGIEDITPPKSLEFLPYSLGRSTLAPSSVPNNLDFFGNLGADIRYGLNSGLSLNATLNPDFGQVEADPAVLNLTVFETFQRERRPFFVEGAQNFQTPIQLFYSRRIGKQPGHFSTPSGFSMVDRPDFTTISGAVKITGKTAHQTSFGIMEALTANEYAALDCLYTDATNGASVKHRDFRIEPRTHFLVGRVKQDLFRGNSHVGLIGTALNRHKAEDAYSGGLDWNLKWRDSAYDFLGQIAGSRAGPEDNRKSGWGSQMAIGKQTGWLRVGLDWEAYSRDFEVNDLGFQWRNNYHESLLWIEFRKDKPWRHFRRNFFTINRSDRWTFDELTLENAITFDSWNQFKNYWEISGYFTHRFRAHDDLNTRGGPPIVKPASSDYQIRVESDDRHALSSRVTFSWGSNQADSRWRTLSPGVTIKPASHILFHFLPRYQWSFSDAQWVRNVDADSDGVTDHFVYGELKSKTLDLTTRLDAIFSPDLSLEFYLRPFLTVGDYKNFKELARPDSYDFTPYELADSPDFRRRSLQSNLVLRWEYRLGSTLFLVWSQSRNDFSQEPEFRLWHDVGNSFVDEGTDIFLIKLNYLVNM